MKRVYFELLLWRILRSKKATISRCIIKKLKQLRGIRVTLGCETTVNLKLRSAKFDIYSVFLAPVAMKGMQ